MKSISEKGILVNLKISQWTARKYDKKVSKQIEQEHNAYNAGNFNKLLIAENELRKISAVANRTRDFLYDNTLPWGDNGDRLLPSTNLFEFINQFNDYKKKFDETVEKFIFEYPSLKQEAQIRLNGMFQETDYPAPTNIKQKFDMQIGVMSIPKTSNFLLEVDAEEVENLKNQIESEIHKRILQGTKNIWTRIKDAVGHMVERLSTKDAVFRNSLIENIQELIELLPRLNFTQDRDISEVIENMKTLVVNPEKLRTDESFRNQKAQEAKAILDKVSDFLG